MGIKWITPESLVLQGFSGIFFFVAYHIRTNFGGYPHGYYSSSYNAGYAAPLWELNSIVMQASRHISLWLKIQWADHLAGGKEYLTQVKSRNGQLITAQVAAAHASICGVNPQAQRFFSTRLLPKRLTKKIIIGRGVPAEWIADGEEIEIKDYSVCKNKKVGYNLSVKGKEVNITFTSDTTDIPFSIELISFKDNIESVSVGEFDETAG